MFTFLLFLSIATVANGDTNLRSNAQVQSRATAPQGTKFYAIMGKISGRKNKLAPGIGVHCLDRGTTKATEAPYDGKVWGEKHGALSVQCCGADNYRDNSDPLKKVRPTFYLFSPAPRPQSTPSFFFTYICLFQNFIFMFSVGGQGAGKCFCHPLHSQRCPRR